MGTPVPAVIAADHLTKQFADGRGVHDLCLTVPAGEVFGLLGPSGAGKSTTLRLLLDLIRPTAGRVTVLPPYVSHDGRSASPGGFDKRVLYVDERWLPEALTGAAVLRPSNIRTK